MAKARQKIKDKPHIGRLVTDVRYRTVVLAALSLSINLAYAVYSCYLGIRTASPWFVTICFYYTLLGFMRFFAVLSGRNSERLTEENRHAKELRLMKRTGILLLLLTLALSGTVVLTVKGKHITAYGTIHMITIATYTFYKITLATVNFIAVKKQGSPLLTTIRKIHVAEAAMSILPMQTSMIASFDGSNGMDLQRMTILTGTGICAIILCVAISMIKTQRRNFTWQNQSS